MFKQVLAVSSVVITSLLAGCGSTPPIKAQDKTVAYQGKTFVFGGHYDQKRNELQLTVNGDPVMRGKFPPYTPTLNLQTNYQDVNIISNCYFGSVLSRKGGIVGAVASAVQNSNDRSGDTCKVKIAGQQVESLYF